MRKIIVVEFVTMDGILQAPGGPEEDRTGGFEYGGWQFGYSSEEEGTALMKIMSTPFDLLLGRKTYEIFSAYWPYQNHEIAEKFNSINKYVVGTTPMDLSWNNSTQIKSDVTNELRKLKEQDGPDLLVHGSSVLVQTLLAHQLVDALHLWTYPITLGKGKKLFDDSAAAQEWKLTDAVVTSTGAILASYLPGGKVKTGTFGTEDPSEAELARRERWAKEG